MSEPHPACELRFPHGPHQIVLQYIDVGVGGRGIPEYSDCPGTTGPDDERAEQEALASASRAEQEERERAEWDNDRDSEARAADESGGPEGDDGD